MDLPEVYSKPLRLPLFAFERACTKCGEQKTLEQFYASKTGRYGYTAECKGCLIKRSEATYAANPERKKERGKAYYREHAEEKKDKQRAYNLTHKASRSAYRKVYYQKHGAELRAKEKIRRDGRLEAHRAEVRVWQRANAERVRQRTALWIAEHADETRTYQAHYRRLHPEKSRHKHKQRRAQKLGGGGRHTHAEWVALCSQYGNRCLRCGSVDPLTEDHIIPLSRGGTDGIGNIQPLCGPCNNHKMTRSWDFRSTPYV